MSAATMWLVMSRNEIGVGKACLEPMQPTYQFLLKIIVIVVVIVIVIVISPKILMVDGKVCVIKYVSNGERSANVVISISV